MTATVEPIRQPPPHLTAAQQQHSRDKRLRVQAALQAMLDEGAIITFAEVARRARVSRSLVYAPGVREEIEMARAQPPRPHRQSASARVPRSEVLLLKTRLPEIVSTRIAENGR
jgi:Family of unknown function (DUF6262)